MNVLIISDSPWLNDNVAIALIEKEEYGLPEMEEWQPTHFIR